MEITIKDVVYELTEPTFAIYSLALQKMLKSSGEINLIDAGKIIFDGCFKGKLDEVQKDVKLYISLCLKCAELVEVYEADLKKN